MRFREYVDSLPPADAMRLVVALGAGLQEARLASQVAVEDLELANCRPHVELAIAHLQDALALLPPAPGDQDAP